MSDGPLQPASIELPASGPSSEELCVYIAEMCGELRGLSRRSGFRMINYLLDMVRLEAERTAKEIRSRAERPT